MTLEPLHRTVPAKPEAVPILREELVHYARSAGIEDAHGLALAVSETVTNAIVHAYGGAEAPGEIVVEATAENGRVQLVISDRGSGMAPRSETPGLGLGLPLVAHFSDHFEIREAPGGGTTVVMAFGRAG